MLKEKIQAEFLAARKARNEIKRTILSVLVGEIQSQESLSGPMEDKEIESKIRKLVQANKETISASVKKDQVIVLDEEIQILESFLPQYLSVDKIAELLSSNPVAEKIKTLPEGAAIGLAVKTMPQIACGAGFLGGDIRAAVLKMRSG